MGAAMTTPKSRLATRMKALRAHFNNISLRALHARSGIPATTMASWERGDVETVGGRNAAALGRALGLEPSVILAYLYDDNPPELPGALPDISSSTPVVDPSFAMYASLVGRLSPGRRLEATNFLLKLADEELEELEERRERGDE